MTKVTSLFPSQARAPGHWLQLPNAATSSFLGSPWPSPYLGVHGGHGGELHAEHALVAVHPAHARQRHLGEGGACRWVPAPLPPPLPCIATQGGLRVAPPREEGGGRQGGWGG